MKAIIILIAFMLVTTSTRAQSGVVWCTNCSDVFTQALDRVTNIEQLTQLYQQVDQAMQQTQQQITMVQQGIDRYANMVRNTTSLPGQMRSKLQGTFGQLSSLTQQLNVQRGDASALSQIFSATYAGSGAIRDLARAPKEGAGAAADTYRQMREKWGDEVDRSQQAAFQESGSQISDIEQKSTELDNQLGDLLLTPEGQMQALEAGNQIAAMQLQESQRLRMLLAVSAQASAQKQMKDEKTEQMQAEAWKDALSADSLKQYTPRDDPF